MRAEIARPGGIYRPGGTSRPQGWDGTSRHAASAYRPGTATGGVVWRTVSLILSIHMQLEKTGGAEAGGADLPGGAGKKICERGGGVLGFGHRGASTPAECLSNSYRLQVRVMLKAGLWIRWGIVPALVLAAGLAGCSSKEQKALDQAKKQAVATGEPQQVSSVDKDGNRITTVVQPPAAGQKQPTVTTTTAPPPAGAPKPAPKDPSVSALGDGQPGGQPDSDEAGQPSGPEQKPVAGQSAAVQPVEVRVPAGTSLAIRVDQRISVKSSRPGDTFTGEVVSPVLASDGNPLIPKGAEVRGRVDAAHKRGHFKGSSVLELRLTAIRLHGQEYPVETADLAQSKKGKGKRSAAMIGGGAGLGMLVGGLAGGGTGLLIGGLAGGGAGTAAAGLTGNRDLVIPAESVVHFKLAQDLVVRVRS